MSFHRTLEDLLIKHEGERLKPYRCTSGKLTIGVGRNLDDNGISRAESRLLLQNDIADTLGEISQHPWFGSLNPTRQIALVDMHFNLGGPRFRSFKRMIEAIEAGDYDRAAIEMMDSRWADQVGQRAVTLSRMMREGRT